MGGGRVVGHKAVNSIREKVFLGEGFLPTLSVPVRDAGFRLLRLENRANEYMVSNAIIDDPSVKV